jgi:hypothetical protein
MAPKRQRQKKPFRYPKKLRHTLERIRANDADESDEPSHRGTLWADFYAHRRGGTTQIEFMHGLIDDSPVEEKHHRLIITNRLSVNATKIKPPKPINIRPPWKVRHETPGSDD